MGHLGIYGDALEENTSAGVIKNIRGATAFLDGHSHKDIVWIHLIKIQKM